MLKVTEMSKTLSVLIVENFVINEGPKWEKFKKVGHGAKKVPLIAGALGAKGKKKKQADKSLKERLNIVKSGMFLNEEDADTTVLEKERYSDGHTPESIATLHNVPVQDILDQIEKGIKVEREHTTDKAEARLIAMDHLVELPDYYTRLDKMEEEGKMENSINESEKKQVRKSLKERLELVKAGMFLNEESADITALRNKINQGLILLPGLKGAAADRMEDSIRSWEDQINELEKK